MDQNNFEHQDQQYPEPDQAPQVPGDTAALMKSAQTLITVSIIAGPVSIIIGGVFLSAVALVCGVLALRKISRAMSRPQSFDKNLALSMRKQAIFALAISGAAFVLNAIALAYVMPVVMSVLETGDYQQVANILQGYGASAGSTGTSVWG